MTPWNIDGQEIETETEEEATQKTLTLTFRVETQTLLEQLRELKTDEGQVETLELDDGGFISVDRAGGENTFAVTPPETRQPLRDETDYHVEAYEETLVSQSVSEWDVTLELVRSENRTDEPTITIDEQVEQPETDTGGTLGDESGFTLGGLGGATLGNQQVTEIPADWWGIQSEYGTIATGRVDADFLGTGFGGVERFELRTRLTKDQTHVIESVLSRLGAVRVRDVADQQNLITDETPERLNTLEIDSPTPDILESGEYVALDFESVRLNDAFNELVIEIASVRLLE